MKIGSRVSCELPMGVNPPIIVSGTIHCVAETSGAHWITLDPEDVERIGLSRVVVLNENIEEELD